MPCLLSTIRHQAKAFSPNSMLCCNKTVKKITRSPIKCDLKCHLQPDSPLAFCNFIIIYHLVNSRIKSGRLLRILLNAKRCRYGRSKGCVTEVSGQNGEQALQLPVRLASSGHWLHGRGFWNEWNKYQKTQARMVLQKRLTRNDTNMEAIPAGVFQTRRRKKKSAAEDLTNTNAYVSFLIILGHTPTPPSRGEMEFQTPMLPMRSLCPTAISRQSRGMPSNTSAMTYGMRNAPEGNS